MKLSISRGACKKALGLSSKRKKGRRGGGRSKNKRKKFRHILHLNSTVVSAFTFDTGISSHHLNSPTFTYTSLHFAQHPEVVEEGQEGIVGGAFSIVFPSSFRISLSFFPLPSRGGK